MRPRTWPLGLAIANTRLRFQCQASSLWSRQLESRSGSRPQIRKTQESTTSRFPRSRDRSRAVTFRQLFQIASAKLPVSRSLSDCAQLLDPLLTQDTFQNLPGSVLREWVDPYLPAGGHFEIRKPVRYKLCELTL